MSEQLLLNAAVFAALLAALRFLVPLWISERLKAALQRETGVFLEQVRWDFKVREQSAKVAEYLALAVRLREDSSEEDYRTADRLAWELAMWLPPDVFRTMARSVTAPSERTNPLVVAIAVRQLLLGDAAGDLGPNEIPFHRPGAGKQSAV